MVAIFSDSSMPPSTTSVKDFAYPPSDTVKDVHDIVQLLNSRPNTMTHDPPAISPLSVPSPASSIDAQRSAAAGSAKSLEHGAICDIGIVGEGPVIDRHQLDGRFTAQP